MKKQVLHSMLHPSHTISEPYLTKTVITDGGRVHAGEISPSAEPGSIVIVGDDGNWATVSEDEIDGKYAQRASAMPDGLLDELTKEEIADLLTYLTTTPDTRLAERPAEEENR
jgi:putative heme-binding domain-containing protein